MAPPQIVAPAKFSVYGGFAMHETASRRTFIHSLAEFAHKNVTLRGWVYRLPVLGKTTFVILKDCTGEAQCVAASEVIR
jgi:nondiscriminating aspartyl-tRNA synthetase